MFLLLSTNLKSNDVLDCLSVLSGILILSMTSATSQLVSTEDENL